MKICTHNSLRTHIHNAHSHECTLKSSIKEKPCVCKWFHTIQRTKKRVPNHMLTPITLHHQCHPPEFKSPIVLLNISHKCTNSHNNWRFEQTSYIEHLKSSPRVPTPTHNSTHYPIEQLSLWRVVAWLTKLEYVCINIANKGTKNLVMILVFDISPIWQRRNLDLMVEGLGGRILFSQKKGLDGCFLCNRFASMKCPLSR